MEQMTIFDFIENPNEVKQKSAWDLFHEVCSKRGWHKAQTETEPAKWMCGFNNCQNARCWGDWIECKEANCPILKKENK